MGRCPVICVGALVALSVALGASDAQSQLRRPTVEPFFVEGWAGLVVPMNDLQQEGCANTGLSACEIRWWPRLEIGVSAGGRVWDPLNLDVGLRLSYAIQKYFNNAQRRQDYSSGIDMIEVQPYVRGAVFPFKTDRWGITLDFGLGMFFAFGGKKGGNPFPEDSQMLVRIRVAFGLLLRWTSKTALTIDALSLVTDVPVTDYYLREVGTQLSFEPRVGFVYRF